MKKTCFASSTLFFTLLILFVACKKDPSDPGQRDRRGIPILPVTPVTPVTPTSPVTNTPRTPKAPIARAGNDTTIYLPFTMINLDGSASSDPDSSKLSFKWRQIAGAANVTLTNPDKVRVSVNGMENVGDYQFELMVRDGDNLYSKDTVKITVTEITCSSVNKEMIFKDLSWDYSWIMEIDFFDFFNLLPPASYLQNVFIKRDGSSDWEKVVPMKLNSADYGQLHEWEYGNGALVIYPGKNMTKDSPDIKIEYCN